MTESFRERYLSTDSLRERIHNLISPTDGVLDYGLMTALSGLAYHVASSFNAFDPHKETVASMGYGAGAYALTLGIMTYIRNTNPEFTPIRRDRLLRGFIRTGIYTAASIALRSIRELEETADKVAGMVHIISGQAMRYTAAPLLVAIWAITYCATSEEEKGKPKSDPQKELPLNESESAPIDPKSSEIHAWLDSHGE